MSLRVPSKTLLNLTPHNIIVYLGEKSVVFYPKTSAIARLTTKTQEQLDTLEDGSPVFEPQCFNGITPTQPEFEEQRGVIVSMPVAEWLRDNDIQNWREVYVADTGPGGAVRDEHGVIIGTKRLVRYL